MKQRIQAIWGYRYFILSSIKTEFKTRFARSKFGATWMILHPLAQVAIYALVLSAVLKAKLEGIDSQYSYAIYLMAGMVGWSLFADIVGRCLNVFIENASLLKKLSFPKITLPIIIIGSSLVNFLLLLFAMFLVFGLLGHIPLHGLIWLPLLMIITLMMAVGIGLFLGVLNVFVRDISQIMTIILQFWFWLTPVVYSISMLPKSYQEYFVYNPMTNVVMAYHDILVYDKVPDMTTLVYPATVGVVTLLLSLFVYKKANEDMADVL